VRFRRLQQLRRLPRTARRYRFRPEDLSVLANQDRRAIGDAGPVQPEAVFLGDLTLGVEVGEEGELDSIEGLGPSLVTMLRVNTQTQNLGLCRVELLQKSVQTRNLDASGGREIKRIRNEEYVLLAPKSRQLDLRIQVAVELEIRGLCPGCDQRHSLYLRLGWHLSAVKWSAPTSIRITEFRAGLQGEIGRGEKIAR